MSKPSLIEISAEAAEEYLLRRRNIHLMQLGALNYDTVKAIIALQTDHRISALAMLIKEAGALPDPRPIFALAADDSAHAEALLTWRGRPARCVVTASDDLLVAHAEQVLRAQRTSGRGLVYYAAESASTGEPVALAVPPVRPDSETPDTANRMPEIRRLTDLDARTLDLTACNLSSTALRGWFRQSWRVFGAIEHGRLVAHALAAYPIDDGDEVAAVYTSGSVRRRGIGSAVVAAVIADIRARGRRAFYVASRHNLASRQLAERLGLQLLTETWEIVMG